MTLAEAIALVQGEVAHAQRKFPPFASAHEGYAIVLEELRELEREVFKNPKTRSHAEMMSEAKQVAAMAIRFMCDVSTRYCQEGQ